MGFKQVTADYEADLFTLDKGLFKRRNRGEVEVKHYGDGSAKMKIKLKGLKLSDGTAVVINIGESFVHAFAVHNGSAREKLTTEDGHEVPTVAHGDAVELWYDDQRLLRGKFRRD